MGDQLSFGKRNLVNFVVKYVKKLVPKYKLPNAVTFREVLSIGKFRQYVRPQVDREDLAFYNIQAERQVLLRALC